VVVIYLVEREGPILLMAYGPMLLRTNCQEWDRASVSGSAQLDGHLLAHFDMTLGITHYRCGD